MRVWDFLSSKTAIDTLRHGSDVTALAFTQTGATLAVATLDGQIQMWDAKEAEQTGTIDGRADAAGGRYALSKASKRNSLGSKHFSSIAFSADGTAVLAGGNSKFVCLYDAEEKTLLKKYTLSDNVSLDGVRMHLNSKHVMPGGCAARSRFTYDLGELYS